MFASLYMHGLAPFNDWFAPDTTKRHQLGTKVTATDEFWGLGEFMYIESGAAILKGSLVIVNGSYVGVLLPNAANQGFPFAVAMNNMASGTFGWVQVAGLAVYKTNATVAADAAIGIGAAGIAGTNAAGKQLLGVRNLVSATGTKTVAANTRNASGVITTSGYQGFFLGMALSGTGIPASTVVAALGSDGRTIYTGSAVGTTGDKNATATGAITLTGTYTGYGQGFINNPFAQGAVT